MRPKNFGAPPSLAACRSERASSRPVPLPRRRRAGPADEAGLCQALLAVVRRQHSFGSWTLRVPHAYHSKALRRPTRNACLRPSPATTSPPTQMRAAVNVQHLAGDLARLGEIEHGLCDVLGVRNLPKGDSVRRNSLGLFLCSGVSTTPGATTFTRMPAARIPSRDSGYCVDTALGDHWDGRSESRKRMIDD